MPDESPATPPTQEARLDAIITEFLSDEASLKLKKEEVIKLLLLHKERPLTLKEHTRLAELREELKPHFPNGDPNAAAPAPTGTPAPSPSPSSPGTAPASFPNLLEVSKYLTAQGWKLSKSTLYNHRTAGRIAPGQDGKFSREAVDQYALANLKRTDGAPSTPETTELDRLQRESIEEELAHRRINRRRAELKLQSEEQLLIPRDAIEKERAARAAVLRSDYDNFCYTQAPAIVDVVAGDQAKTPDLIAYLLSAGELWFARYAEDREIILDPPSPSASPAATPSTPLPDDYDPDAPNPDEEDL